MPIDARVCKQRLDHRRNVAVAAQPRQPDGIERIAEGALDAENVLDAGVGFGCDRRKIDPRRLAEIADQRRGAARHGHHHHAVALRQRRQREQRGGLDQRVDGINQRHAVLPEQRGEGLVPAGERSGMRERRALAEFAAAELQHHDRLGAGGALDRGAEAAAVARALHDAGDHPRRRIVGQEAEIVGHVEHGLVAAGDQIVDADAAVRGQFGERVEKPAALRDQRNAAGARFLGNVRHGGGEAIVQARKPHAVRSGNRHVGGARLGDEPLLARAAILALGIGKAFGDDVGSADAGRGSLGENVEHRLGRHRDHGAVRHFGERGERFVAALSGDLGGVRIDRPDRHRIAEARARLEDVRAGAALRRDADQRNRARSQEHGDRRCGRRLEHARGAPARPSGAGPRRDAP
jgi:hypothetical protein